jgi:hypothetical protein
LDRELFRHLICTIVGFLFRSLLFLWILLFSPFFSCTLFQDLMLERS